MRLRKSELYNYKKNSEQNGIKKRGNRNAKNTRKVKEENIKSENGYKQIKGHSLKESLFFFFFMERLSPSKM